MLPVIEAGATLRVSPNKLDHENTQSLQEGLRFFGAGIRCYGLRCAGGLHSKQPVKSECTCAVALGGRGDDGHEDGLACNEPAKR